MAFPVSPTEGQVYGDYRYDSTLNAWVKSDKDKLHISGTLNRSSNTGVANMFWENKSYGGLSFSSDRIIVPRDGIYLITLNTISDRRTVRFDVDILVNGSNISSLLTVDGTSNSHHQINGSLSVYLQKNDYIQFYSEDWYNIGTSTEWNTASVTFIK